MAVFISSKKTRARSRINNLIQKFLSEGGEIQKVESSNQPESSGKTRFSFKDTTPSKSDPDGQSYIERSFRRGQR